MFNVGPMPDGRIEPRQVDRLKEMGIWLQQYGDAVYGTRGGPYKPGKWGASTCQDDKIYLFVMNWPKEGPLRIPVPSMKFVKAAHRNGGFIKINQADGLMEIEVSEKDCNPIVTVIELTVA